MEKIPIVLSANDKFADLCSVAISSIIQNGNINNLYDIYIFYTRLSNENIKRLEQNTKQNISIKCINISEFIDFKNLYEIENYTYEIYYRYYIPLILKYEKVIYLDSDIIVVDDIAKLYNEDIGDAPVGVVRDFTHYIDHSNFDFNSGIMLINTKKFEELKIRDKCIELIKKNNFRFPDQNALNIVCKDNAYLLEPKYNYQVSLAYYHRFKKEIRKNKFKHKFEEEPIIIHFSYVTKPTNNIYSKYNKDFWKYAKYTPYYNQLVDKFLADPYKVLRESPIEDIYIDMAEEGKVGLRKIFETLLYQLKYWILYKIRRKDKCKNEKDKRITKKNSTSDLSKNK